MSRLMRLRNTEVVVYPDEPIQVVKQQESRPGKGVATLELKNDSSSIARFTVTLTWTSYVPQGDWIKISDVEGDPNHIDAAALQASHYDSGTRTLTTYLGRYSEKLVNISFKVPKIATARAGRYELKVTVEKKTKQGEASDDRVQSEKITLFIQPFYDAAVSAEVVTPLQMSRSFRRRKRYQVTISSRSNDWSYYRIAHGGHPNFETFCDQEVFAVPPGLANGPQTRSFWISAKYKPAKKGHFFYGPDELNKEVPLSINRIDAPSVLRFNLNYERDLECDARYVSSKGFNPPQSIPLEKKALMSFLPTIPMGSVALWQRIVSGLKGMVGLVFVVLAMMLCYSYIAERFFVLNRIRISGSPCEGREGDCYASDGVITISGAGIKGARVVGVTSEGREYEFGAPIAKKVEELTGARRATETLSRTSQNLKSPMRDVSAEFSVAEILKSAKTLEFKKIRIARPLFGWLMLGDLLSKDEPGPFILGALKKTKLSFTLSTPSVVWRDIDSDVSITLTPEAGASFGDEVGIVRIGSQKIQVSGKDWTPEGITMKLERGQFTGSQTVYVTTKDSREGSASISFSEPDVPLGPDGELDLGSTGGGETQPDLEVSPGGPDSRGGGGQQSGNEGQGNGGSDLSLDQNATNGDSPETNPSQPKVQAARLEEGIYIRYIEALMKGNERRAVQLMEGSQSPLRDPLLAFAHAAAGDVQSAQDLLNGMTPAKGVQELFYRSALAMVKSSQGDEGQREAQRMIVEDSEVKISKMPVGASWPALARAYYFRDRDAQRKVALKMAADAAVGEREKAVIKAMK